MPGVLAERIQQLRNFQLDIDQVVLDLVRDRERDVVQMNVDQLMAGIDGNGNQITPPYAASTIVRKLSKGEPYDRVTLRDQGDFHGSFGIEYLGDEFQITNDDPKAVYLVGRYGPDVVGLTQENVDRLAQMIKGRLIEELQKQLR